MKKSDQQQIVSILIVILFVMAGFFLLKGTKAPVAENKPVINKSDYASLVARQGGMVSPDDHIIGNPNAELVIIEYSDLECPFCKLFHNTMHQVIESDQNVAWVFRHYPIPQLHPKAFHEAEASECAWEQGGDEVFWQYVDRIFEITPSNNGLETAELSNIAKYLDIDIFSFKDCLDSGKYRNKVQADIDQGIADGVDGTPSSFIVKNGEVIEAIPGAQPFQAVMQILSALK